MHSDIEVVPFRIRRADVFRVRVAFDGRLFDPGAFGGAVATLPAFRRFAVQLHKLGVVDIAPEGTFNCLQIRLVAIRGELHAIGKT